MKRLFATFGLLMGIFSIGGTAALAQQASQAFEIIWNFNGNKSGVSTNNNFLVQDASLPPESFNKGFVTVAGDNQALVAQNWPAGFESRPLLQFEFTPREFEFDLQSMWARLKRTPNGARLFTVSMTVSKFKSSEDSLTIQIGAFSLPDEEYTTITLFPLQLLNQQSTYKLQIFGFGASAPNEDLLFDYVKVTGDRTDRLLPVKLTYFKAEPAGDRIDLLWETAWERNSKEFVIQRSSDLKEFGDIGTLKAAGQAEGRRRYIFSDPTPLLGASYYRLRSVDLDGTYEYSKPVDVLYRPGQPTLLVGPNPVTDNVIRLRTFGIESSTLRLTTLLGQSVPMKINALGTGEIELLPKSQLAQGIYLLTGDTASKPLTVKVLVR